MNRKRLLLAVLVGLLVLSLGYAFWAMPRQEKAPPRAEGVRAKAKKPVAGKIASPPADRLHLGLLSQESQPFPGAARDIFRFRGGGAAGVNAVDETTPPAVVEEAPPPPPPPPPTPEEILREKAAEISFRGFLDKGGVRTVFLSYEGELSLVKAGESIGKKRELVAKEITASELVVGSVDGPETVKIKLVEKETFAPAMMTSGAPPQGAGSGGIRPGGAVPPSRGSILPPRRSVLQPRAAVPPVSPEEEPAEPDGQAPNEKVTQEELLKQLPGGDGNGNNR